LLPVQSALPIVPGADSMLIELTQKRDALHRRFLELRGYL